MTRQAVLEALPAEFREALWAVHLNDQSLIDGLRVGMQGPYDADMPRQVVCYFKHKPEGDLAKGAPVELDKRLGSVIAALWDRGEFVGDELETMLIESIRKILARRLLLIGLGDQAALSLERTERIGRVAYRGTAKSGAADRRRRRDHALAGPPARGCTVRGGGARWPPDGCRQ